MDTWSLRIDSEYDAAGNRTRLTYPGGAKFDYCYTSGGQFDKMGFYNTCPNAASAGLVDFTYDDRGQLTGAARASAALDQTFSYDPVGRMSFNAWGGSSDTDAVSWTLSRNPASQINTQALTNTAYSWDARYEHGLATTTYQTNGLNQYTDINGKGHCYDANGNLTGDGDGEGANAYLYDFENRLVEVRAYTNCAGGAANYSGTIKARLYYDPVGRLHEVRNFASGTVNSRTKFLYDGDAMIAEYTGGDVLLRRHLHGPVAGADDPLVTFEGTTATSSNATFLYADVRGSIAYRSNAAGTNANKNTYDPYGQPGTANAGRFQYTGQAWLDEVGLYHYKARFYSPILGRFLQVDPIGYEDQVNLYAYVANDPINGVDPTGTSCTGSRINSDAGSICGGGGNYGSSSGTSGFAPGLGKREPDGVANSQSTANQGFDGSSSPESVEAGVEASNEIVVTRRSGCWIICRIVRALGIRSTGLRGESVVRQQFDIGPTTRIEADGRARYPDGLNQALGTISEVKNVSRLSLTSQLRSYLAYSEDRGLTFNLYIRVGTKLSTPLAELEASGAINVIRVPGM